MDQKIQNTALKLAVEHWKYIEALLQTHGIEENSIDEIGFHYRTAFIHGFKHGVEYLQENERVVTMTVDELKRIGFTEEQLEAAIANFKEKQKSLSERLEASQ